jgi:hypothetical protein
MPQEVQDNSGFIVHTATTDGPSPFFSDSAIKLVEKPICASTSAQSTRQVTWTFAIM